MRDFTFWTSQPLNPNSRARTLAALVAVVLAAAVAFSYAGNKEQAADTVQYRWTGAADDSQWSNAANWQFLCTSGVWRDAEAPPVSARPVIFGDATEADEPQLVEGRDGATGSFQQVRPQLMFGR